MGKSGKGLGIFALLIAIVALGLGVYQIILPSPSEASERPRIYTDTNYEQVNLNIVSISNVIPNLIVNYSANVGDNVILEYSGNVFYSGTPLLIIYFYVNGTPPSPYAEMKLEYPTPNRHCPVLFRFHFQVSVLGLYFVQVSTGIDEGFTGTYLKNSVLKVTVY